MPAPSNQSHLPLLDTQSNNYPGLKLNIQLGHFELDFNRRPTLLAAFMVVFTESCCFSHRTLRHVAWSQVAFCACAKGANFRFVANLRDRGRMKQVFPPRLYNVIRWDNFLFHDYKVLVNYRTGGNGFF